MFVSEAVTATQFRDEVVKLLDYKLDMLRSTMESAKPSRVKELHCAWVEIRSQRDLFADMTFAPRKDGKWTNGYAVEYLVSDTRPPQVSETFATLDEAHQWRKSHAPLGQIVPVGFQKVYPND